MNLDLCKVIALVGASVMFFGSLFVSQVKTPYRSDSWPATRVLQGTLAISALSLLMLSAGWLFGCSVDGPDGSLGIAWLLWSVGVAAGSLLFFRRPREVRDRSWLRFLVAYFACTVPLILAESSVSVPSDALVWGFSRGSPWRATLTKEGDDSNGALHVVAYSRVDSLPFLQRKAYDRSFSVPYDADGNFKFDVSDRAGENYAEVRFAGRVLDTFRFSRP